jgi:hypothetical protein
MGSVRAYLVTATLLVWALSPLRTERDSFPHSTYPMFATTPPAARTVQVAHGLDADGRIRRLSPAVIGGSAEIVHAYSTLRRAAGDGDSARLCTEIATRVARSGPSDVRTVVVAEERHDLVASLVDGLEPLDRTEHARCPVPDDGPGT